MKCWECKQEEGVVVTFAGALCVRCWLRRIKALLASLPDP